eukprot:jgi/Antlo1/279/2484
MRSIHSPDKDYGVRARWDAKCYCTHILRATMPSSLAEQARLKSLDGPV